MKGVLLAAGVFFAGTAVMLLPVPLATEARVLQYLLSIGLQAAAAVLASILAWRAGTPYWEGSRERLLWKRTSLAAALWAAALVAQAINDWVGRGPAYPSVADILFLASAGVLTGTFIIELNRAGWLFSRRHRALVYVGSVVLWVAVARLLLWPAAMIPPHTLGEGVSVVYATLAVLLFALAVNRVVTARVGLIGSGWPTMASGAALLAVAMGGVVYLTWLEMYSHVHAINVVRIAGLCLLGASAAWHGDAWRSESSRVRTSRVHRPGQSIWSAISARVRNGGRHRAPTSPPMAAPPLSGGPLTEDEWQTSPFIVPSISAPSLDVAPSIGLSPATNGLATSGGHSPTAEELLAAGRLREAQEAYLNTLLLYGTDRSQEALRGLIMTRRRVALDNATILREQAEAYYHAAARGFETEERYAPQAMELLAKASVLAAAEIDSEHRQQPLPTL